MPESRGTFLIVHGAWTGGWSWERVAEALRGHRAHVPTLTGLCERAHLAGPDVTLDTHIDDIVNEALYKDLSDIVLVAHSYGGMVGTGVAERIADRLSAVVFVEAFIPRDGMSFADFAPGADFSPPLIAPPESAEGEYLDDADRLLADRRATPQPSGTFTQKLRVTGAYRGVPKKSLVVATGKDGPFDETTGPREGDPGWTTYRLPCGHDIPLDMPLELADILARHA